MFKFLLFVACLVLNAFIFSKLITANATMGASSDHAATSDEFDSTLFTHTTYPTIISHNPIPAQTYYVPDALVDDVNKYINTDSTPSASTDSGSIGYQTIADEGIDSLLESPYPATDVASNPRQSSRLQVQYTATPLAVTPPVHPRGPQPPDTRLPYSIIFSGTGWKLIAESLSRAAARSSKTELLPLSTPVVTQGSVCKGCFPRAGWAERLELRIDVMWMRFGDWCHAKKRKISMPGLPASVSCHVACTKNNLTSTLIVVLLLTVIFLLLCIICGGSDGVDLEKVDLEEVDPEEVDTDEIGSSVDSEFDEEQKENYIPRYYAGEAWGTRPRFESSHRVTRGYTNMPSHGGPFPSTRGLGGGYLQEITGTGSGWTHMAQVRPERSQMLGSETSLSIEEQVERQLLHESILHTQWRDQEASERLSSIIMRPPETHERSRHWEPVAQPSQAPIRFSTQVPQTPNQFRAPASQTPNQFRTPAPRTPSQFRTQASFRDGAVVSPSTSSNQHGQLQTNQEQGSEYVNLLRQALEEAPQTPRISPAVAARSQTPPPPPRRSQRLSSRAATPCEEILGHKVVRTPRGPRNLRYL